MNGGSKIIDMYTSETVQEESKEICRIKGKRPRNHTALRRTPFFCLWVTALLLVLVILSGSQLAAQDLEETPDFTICDDGHYAWTGENTISDRCLDCAQEVNKFSIDHDGTVNNKGCGLWNSVEKCLNDSNCPGINKDYSKNFGIVIFDKSKQKLCHWLVVPSDPVIGAEDKNNREKITPNYWYCAWAAASIPVIEPTIIPKTEIGLVVNPATHRTQHQLHIHIGRLPNQLRQTLTLNTETLIPHYPDFAQITVHPSGKTGTKNEHICWATFITPKNYQLSGGFPAVFTIVSEQVHEHNMINYGIIVAGANAGEEEGYYICDCEGWGAEGALDYRCMDH